MLKKELNLQTIKILVKKLSCGFYRYLINLFNFVCPHRCFSCRKIIGGEGFCVDCWKNLRFIEKPYCFVCGRPINISDEMGLVCGQCLKNKYYFDRNISVFVYNETIARVIFEFKFHEKTFLSKFFAKFLLKKLEELGEFCEKIDFITCVPLHTKRLRFRGYNQSLLLANDLAKITQIPCIYDMLLKVKNTKTQVQLSYKKRKTNLLSAFILNKKYLELIKGKNILLIDDVFTTGSTVNECSKVLKRVGRTNKVFVLTIARVVKSC